MGTFWVEANSLNVEGVACQSKQFGAAGMLESQAREPVYIVSGQRQSILIGGDELPRLSAGWWRRELGRFALGLSRQWFAQRIPAML